MLIYTIMMVVFINPFAISAYVNADVDFLRLLHTSNPWWLAKTVPSHKVPDFRRRDFYPLQRDLQGKTNEIIAIVGPRRVGKTTLLYQLISDLIHREVDPRRILYLSADDPELLPSESPLQQALDTFSTEIVAESLSNLTDVCYVFLDEIHHSQNWQLYLKKWYDLGLNIRMIVSGSSSADIVKGGSQALVGRMSPRIMLPMKFLETTRFKMPEQDELLQSYCNGVRGALVETVREGKRQAFEDSLDNWTSALIPFVDRISILLNQYLIRGGYPELLFLDSMAEWNRKLRDYIDLTIYKDIVRVFGIRNPRGLGELLTIVARETSQRMNYPNMAENLGLKVDTVRSYVEHLEEIFLVSQSHYYSKSSFKPLRKERKIIVRDPGICNTAAGRMNETPPPDQELGKVAESVVNDHCKRLVYNIAHQLNPQTYYWRNARTEVDVVIEIAGKPIPIEVKYTERISSSDTRGIKSFSNEHDPPISFLVTRSLSRIEEDIIYIPLWKFLLMC